MRLPLAPALALALAPAALADTLTVGPFGAGADFDSLQAAVAAAQPGDTVLVAAGLYQEVGTIVIDKPLTLLGAGSDTTRYGALPTTPNGASLPLHVTGIPAGGSVRVAGLQFLSSTALGSKALGVVVEDCAGPVAFVDAWFEGSPKPFPGPLALATVRDSAQVTLTGCELDVNPGAGPQLPVALLVENSTVTVVDGWIRGDSSGVLFSEATVYDGEPGIRAVNSTVRLARTTVFGGDGAFGTFFATPTAATSGGAAIEAQTSNVFVRGGAGNRLQGGQGGTGIADGQSVQAPAGAALLLSDGSVGSTTADVVAAAGTDQLPTTVPTVDGPGQYVALGSALATLGIPAPLVPPGGLALLELGGAPGATALPFASVVEGQAKALAGILGPVLLPQAAAIALPPRVLDGAGEAGLGVAIPGVPALVGVAPVFQSVTVDGATVSASPPVFVVIG